MSADDFSAAADAEGEVVAYPARVAVGVMLARALVAAGKTAEAAGADGAVTLLALPDPAWREIAIEHWRASVRHGKRGSDGERSGSCDI